MISNKEKKRRQHQKELNSLKLKMGKNIVWFESLSLSKQYDFLFSWKRHKFINSAIVQPYYVLVSKLEPVDPKRPWGRKKRVKYKQLKYPPSLKHFISLCRKDYRFKPKTTNVRETTINLLFKN